MPAFNTVDAQTMKKERNRRLRILEASQDAESGVIVTGTDYQLVISMAGAPNKKLKPHLLAL